MAVKEILWVWDGLGWNSPGNVTATVGVDTVELTLQNIDQNNSIFLCDFTNIDASLYSENVSSFNLGTIGINSSETRTLTPDTVGTDTGIQADHIGSAGPAVTITIVSSDTEPNPFDSLMGDDVTGANTLQTYNFNTFTPDGYNSPTSISITDNAPSGTSASYEINSSGTWFNKNDSAQTLSPGNTVRVRVFSSSSPADIRTGTLTIGGVSGSVSVTTDGDQLPDVFDFTDKLNQNTNVQILSGPETPIGYNQTADVEFVTNPGNVFEVSINGNAYGSSNTTISPTQTIQLRHPGIATYGTSSQVEIRIGSASDGWRNITWDVSTAAEDFTPANYNIGFDREDVALSSTQESSDYQVSGLSIGTQASITATGSAFFKVGATAGAGTYTQTATTVENLDWVRVKIDASSNYAVDTTGTVTIGTETENFSARTLEDTVPAGYAWTDETNQELNDERTSNTITVSSITTPVTCTITNTNFTGVQYNKAGAGFVNYTGPFSIANNETLALRGTTSGSYSTAHTLETDIGSPAVSDTWSVTTRAEDNVPDSLAGDFGADVTNAEPGTLYSSSTVTLLGMDTTATTTVAFTGTSPMQFRRSSPVADSWRSSPFTYSDAKVNDQFQIRVTPTASVYSTTYTATIIPDGNTGLQDQWSVTTRAEDVTPNSFDLGANLTNVAKSTEIVALNKVTVAGLDTGTTISADVDRTAGTGTVEFKRTGDTVWRDTAYVYSDVDNGDEFSVRITTPNADNATTTARLDIGTVNDTWSVTTQDAAVPSGSVEIPSGLTLPISQRDMMDFFGGDDSTYIIRADNLTAYNRGGTYVPDITTNTTCGWDSTGINTSAPIELRSFVGSATTFFMSDNPTNLSDVEVAYSGGGPWVLAVQWDVGDPSFPASEWAVGYGPGMWTKAEYKYDVTNLTAEAEEGTTISTGDITITSGTSPYTTYDPGNTFIRFEVSSNNANTQKLYAGTVTFYARHVDFPGTTEVSATANFSLNYLSNQ